MRHKGMSESYKAKQEVRKKNEVRRQLLEVARKIKKEIEATGETVDRAHYDRIRKRVRRKAWENKPTTGSEHSLKELMELIYEECK